MHDVTATATWTSSNTSVATLSNAAGSQGQVTGGPRAGSATITATVDSVSASISMTVLAILTINSISPTSGPARTQVILSGSVFGTAPGQVWLGTKPGSVLGWSDTQIAATVANGSQLDSHKFYKMDSDRTR